MLCIDLRDGRKILENLDSKYFQHPLDMAATNNLAKAGDTDPERLEETAERNRLIAENKTLCPDCGGKLTWIEEYNRWYCYSCEKYP